MQRFEDFMGSLRLGRRFVTVEDERALMRVGLDNFNLPLDDSRSAIMNAARRNDLVLESQIADEITFLLEARANRRGRISRADFQGVVDTYRAQAGGRIPRPEAESRVKQLAQQAGVQPARAGWLWPDRSWFNRIPPAPAAPLADAVQNGPGVQPGLIAPQPQPAVAFAGAPGNPAADAAAVGGADVGGVLAAWAAALSARDVPAILRLYAPNALLMATAAGTPLSGPEQIRGYFTQLGSNPGLTVSFNQELQRLPGQPVVVSGLYTFFWNDQATGQPVTTPARYTFGILPAGAGGGGINGRIILHHSSRVPGPNPDSQMV
jgi:ketosteroid isomerase-like protein